MARDADARLSALGGFADVAGAMRAIAAGNLQQAETVRAAAAAYLRELDALTADIFGAPAPGTSPPAVCVAFAAEHGFCAAFDDQVLAEAARLVASGARIVLAGRRGARRAREAGLRIDLRLGMAAHCSGLDDCVAALAAVAAPALAAGPVRLIAMRNRPGATALAVRDVAAPPAGAAAANPPLANLPHRDLAAALGRENLQAALFLFASESFAAENAARFARMDAACRRARDMADDLRLTLNRDRQESISTEIFEVFSARPRARDATLAR